VAVLYCTQTNVVLDIWTMHAGIRFDNILLTTNETHDIVPEARVALRSWITAEVEHHKQQLYREANKPWDVQCLEFVQEHWVIFATLAISALLLPACMTFEATPCNAKFKRE
jgi:hypothetical protein